MRTFAVITVFLLCSLTWSCVSVSDFDTVDVQSGDQVKLLCSNFSHSTSQIFWFRAVKRLKPHCIGFIFHPSDPASFCDGFQTGRFEATSNMSTLFLTVRKVDVSDSGLYFCGYHISGKPVVVSATYLQVQEVFDVPVQLVSVILGGLIVFLTMIIIGLIVKIKWLQKAHIEEQNPQQAESQDSDDLNYAAVTFRSKRERNLSPALERNVEPNAIYSATR